MTNWDSVLQSRDIAVLTKAWVVECVGVSSGRVQMQEWDRKEAEELMLLNCGVGEDSWEPLGQQGDPTDQS